MTFNPGSWFRWFGGTNHQRGYVVKAILASSFPWEVLPVAAIAINIGSNYDSEATVAQVYLDSDLFNSGRFGYGVIQHELGHQVDWFLLNDSIHDILLPLLGGRKWDDETLQHEEQGKERFADGIAYAFCDGTKSSMYTKGLLPPKAFKSVLLAHVPAIKNAISKA